MAKSAGPNTVSLLTCLNVLGNERPTLVEVFRSLASIPQVCYVYIEFEYDEAFSFRIRLFADHSDQQYQSEDILVLSGLSGRGEEAIPLMLHDGGVSPGAYTVVVESTEDGRELASRRLFLGEL